MANYILNTIRVILLGSLVFWGVVLGATESGNPEQDLVLQEVTITEPAAAPTEAPEPTEIETTTETTAPETEPTVATEPATEPPAEPTETEPPYTQEELDLLALVIYQEAGGDYYSDETRLMVGTVVMNRIASDLYPNTMYEVVTQYGQYGKLYWTGPVWPSRASHHTEAHAVERAYQIAERILLGERTLPDDVIYQAEFAQGTEVVAFQNGMYFCR